MAKTPYAHLSLSERQTLIRLHTQGMSCRGIALQLGRSHTTIARELKRNLHTNNGRRYYTFTIAHRKAMGRRSRARKKSRYTEDQWEAIEELLRRDWSPEQVAHVLRMEDTLSISHESIYRHVYQDKRAGGTLYMHLRLRCRKRRKRYRSKDSRGILRGKTMINDRPKEIEDRQSIGHWEIDTVMGQGGKECIVTLVERKTRYLWIGKLRERTVARLNEAVLTFARTCPLPILTITADNGSEFHGYKIIEEAIGVKFYFAQPHHAWERGTNENTNGLIRQYLPKGKSMKDVTQGICNSIAHRLNTRPRKRLQFRAPLRAAEETA